MTATHSPGCPALADVRDGCACLLRQMMAPLLDHLIAAQGDHLPECPCVRWPDLPSECLCSLLRACEERVREEEQVAAALEIARKTSEHYAYGRADALTQMLDAGNVMGQEFYSKGFADALDAACEAVGNARMRDVRDGLIAVAAIANLKERP